LPSPDLFYLTHVVIIFAFWQLEWIRRLLGKPVGFIAEHPGVYHPFLFLDDVIVRESSIPGGVYVTHAEADVAAPDQLRRFRSVAYGPVFDRS